MKRLGVLRRALPLARELHKAKYIFPFQHRPLCGMRDNLAGLLPPPGTEFRIAHLQHQELLFAHPSSPGLGVRQVLPDLGVQLGQRDQLDRQDLVDRAGLALLAVLAQPVGLSRMPG